MKPWFLAATLLLTSPLTHADWFDAIPSWSFTGAMGLTNVDNMYQQDGQTAIGRIGIQRYLLTNDDVDVGLELSLQSGNSMRMDIPQATLDALGGLPIELTLKPMMDTLLSVKFNNISDDFFVFFKGGVAYRRAQIDRVDVNDKALFQPEVQGGIGYILNDKLNLFVSYQRIFGGNPNFSVDFDTEIASIQNIPTQQSVFLGVSFLF